MKKEIRVYLVDIDDTDEVNAEVNPESPYFRERAFMNTAEKYGLVYSLLGFQKAVNNSELDYYGRYYIYFKEVECND